MGSQTYTGQNFVLHIRSEDDQISIGLASEYVYTPVDKDELKGLADFILKYLENN